MDATSTRSGRPAPAGAKHLAVLAVSALGIVYGDIGTSPLYALRECFHGAHAVEPSAQNVLGVLSLVFWALVVTVTLKYHVYVLRADNHGEGGILALMALVRGQLEDRRWQWLFVALGLFGAALLYGDGAITPAISVLSAVEGLEVATPVFKPYVVPATLAILIALFFFQRRGTGGIGSVFGPIMAGWFLCIAGLGAAAVVRHPAVLAAVDPRHALRFFAHNGGHGFLVLGAVFLVATGGEALYADMGHFGELPIQIDWFGLVGLSLVLNYFGQGAVLLENPQASFNPFYHLAPGWALYPLVALATVATVIASQAVISGAFSLTSQAVQLGYLPRLTVVHTSRREIGQVYVPLVNWLLMLATLGLVLGFGSSGNLAAAYGIAVSTTMVITTVLAYVVSRLIWRWKWWISALVTGAFLAVDLSFFGANMVKVAEGGWFPLLAGAAIFTVMATWNRGRRVLKEQLAAGAVPFADTIAGVRPGAPPRVPGTAVFLSRDPQVTPTSLLHNLKHNRVLHERVLLLSVVNEEVPYVARGERCGVEDLGKGFFRAQAHYGFMQRPLMADMIDRLRAQKLDLRPEETTFFLARASVVVKSSGIRAWRDRLFAFLERNELRPTDFLEIPPNQVVELGLEVDV
jgi:KUP system potassium uptake protein